MNKVSFEHQIKEIASQAIRELKPVHATISSYEVAESKGISNSEYFTQVISRITGVMDPILTRLYTILEEHDTIETPNIGTNLLHIGRRYALMVEQLTSRFDQKIHFLNGTPPAVPGYGKLWNTLLTRFEKCYQEIKEILEG